MAKHEGLVGWVVRRQRLGGLPFADALQEGRIGLWRALAGYDPTRGIAFSSYAVPAITRALWRAVASQESAGGSDESASLVGRTWPSVEWPDVVEDFHQASVRAELRSLVGQLPERLREVTASHYGLAGLAPESYAAIGRRLGVSRQRVQQLQLAAIVWLAQPTHSLALRRLLGRNRATDYNQALRRQNRLARARRGLRRSGR